MDLFRGLSLLARTPRLWPYALFPTLAALAAYLLIGYAGWIALAPHLADWLGEWDIVGKYAALALYLIVFPYLFFFLGGAFVEVIFEPLARAVEREIGDPIEGSELSRRAAWKDAGARFLLNALLGVAAFLLTLIVPALGVVPGLVTAGLVGLLDYTAPASVRRGMTLRPQLKAILRRPDFGTVLFGASAGFLSLVPVVGPLAAPVLVVGGTLLVRRRVSLPEGGAAGD